MPCASGDANIAVIRGPEFARRNRLFVQTGATAEFGRCKTLSLIRMLRYFLRKSILAAPADAILRELQIHRDSTGRALFGLRWRKVDNAPVGNTLLAETTPINRDKRAQELQRAICPCETRPIERAVVA